MISYILSSTATSFISCRWCPSSTSQIFSTLTSALSYFALSAVTLLPDFLKKPRNPFSSSSTSKLFSSVTRPEIISPTSPRSFVFTFFKAVSEKSAIFFCVPTPYCKIPFVLWMSICLLNSSTIRRSSSLSMLSSSCGCAGSSFTATGSGFSSTGAPKLSVGVGTSVNSLNCSSMIVLPAPFSFLLFAFIFCQMHPP